VPDAHCTTSSPESAHDILHTAVVDVIGALQDTSEYSAT